MTTLAISFESMPASYCRGVERAARDSGLVTELGTPVTFFRLDRTPQHCARVDQLVAAGITVALLEPFDVAGITHALEHGAWPADHSAEPERVVDAAVAAVGGNALIPVGLLKSMSGPGASHDELVLTEEESAWLVALAGGATVVKIADDFGYSERALFRRLHDLYGRLGVANRAEAMVTAERRGLLYRNGN